MPCSDHGSDALMWAAGNGPSEESLLNEIIKLTGGAEIDRESHLGDTALTIACSRQENRGERGNHDERQTATFGLKCSKGSILRILRGECDRDGFTRTFFVYIVL